VIYHDRAGDLRPDLFGALEIEDPAAWRGFRLVPLSTDSGARVWILEVSAS
jgi:hypothetical protein